MTRARTHRTILLTGLASGLLCLAVPASPAEATNLVAYRGEGSGMCVESSGGTDHLHIQVCGFSHMDASTTALGVPTTSTGVAVYWRVSLIDSGYERPIASGQAYNAPEAAVHTSPLGTDGWIHAKDDYTCVIALEAAQAVPTLSAPTGGRVDPELSGPGPRFVTGEASSTHSSITSKVTGSVCGFPLTLDGTREAQIYSSNYFGATAVTS